MTTSKFKPALGLFLSLLAIVFFYYSCRKDIRNTPQPVSDPIVAQAKAWYESAYPASRTGTSHQTTNSIDGTSFDFSQFTKPDWEHASRYQKLGNNVIEMLMDSTAQFNFNMKDASASAPYYDKKYTRTYFLLMNDGKNYEAYVMMVVADPAYVKNDTTKLSHNTYRKNDPDFSGVVLYFTPKGEYINGYAYQNGQLLGGPVSVDQTIQSTTGSKLKVDLAAPVKCTDWYLITYDKETMEILSTQYLFTSCSPVTTGGGSDGGGSSAPPPPPPCTPTTPPANVSSTGHLTINVAAPPPGGGFPPPAPCPPTATKGTTTPVFGLNNSNAQILQANFVKLLNYVESIGLSYSVPYDYSVTGNDGTIYTGEVTAIYNAQGVPVAAYFTPDVNSSLFQVGMEYAIPVSGTGTDNPTGSTTTNTAYLEFGDPQSNIGSNSTIAYKPGGTTPVPHAPIVKTDSLKKHFPCATALIINPLSNIPAYITLVSPFQSYIKPNLVWTNGSLPWNAPIPNSTLTTYQLGQTSYTGRSATITLNTSMLQNSSKLLIASAAIHETLHAYINYNIETAVGGFLPPQNFNITGSWFYALDTWATINGVPSNYRDHYEMLNDYFSKAVSILAAWDNNAHTPKEYEEAMLYGLDNSSGASAAQQTLLQTEFNSLLTKYGITTTDLSNFNKAQLNPTLASDKLPPGGCL